MRSVCKETIISALLNSLSTFNLLGIIAIFTVSARGGDREILDQLYQEIMSSQNVSGAKDTSVPATKLDKGTAESAENNQLRIPYGAPGFDPASEKLQQEIRKMVEEAKIRHDDAVKFMQDNK